LETFARGGSYSEHSEGEANVLDSEGWSHRINIDTVDQVTAEMNEILRSFSQYWFSPERKEVFIATKTSIFTEPVTYED